MKADQPNKNKEREVAVKRYRDVMKCIIRRYVTAEQKKTEEFSITEDDVSEIRQDINKFRSVANHFRILMFAYVFFSSFSDTN